MPLCTEFVEELLCSGDNFGKGDELAVDEEADSIFPIETGVIEPVSDGAICFPPSSGATVEDMYRPERRANTAGGMVEVTATGP